jgi:hypothetical protein
MSRGVPMASREMEAEAEARRARVRDWQLAQLPPKPVPPRSTGFALEAGRVDAAVERPVAIHPVTGKPLIDISKAPSAMEERMKAYRR